MIRSSEILLLSENPPELGDNSAAQFINSTTNAITSLASRLHRSHQLKGKCPMRSQTSIPELNAYTFVLDDRDRMLDFDASAATDPRRRGLKGIGIEAADLLTRDSPDAKGDTQPQLLSGIDGAKRLRETRPSLRVLLMSGYTDRTPGQGGIPTVMGFLQRPFTLQAVAHKVRETLDQPVLEESAL